VAGLRIKLLAKLPSESIPVAFFAPQYRGILDKMSYGSGEATRPQLHPLRLERVIIQAENKLRAQFARPKDLPAVLNSPPSGGKITAVPQFSSIARPYAEAIFALAREADDFDRWSAFLARAAVVAADAQVVRLIQDPRVARETLLGIVADLSIESEGESEARRNFLRLLIANRRARALPDIAAHYERLRAEAEGTVDAELVTAFAVSDAQKEKIAAALGKKLGRKVRLGVSEDGGLIGGAIIRAGDMVIDASARGQLEQLKNALRA